MKVTYLLLLTFLIPLFTSANSPEVYSALQFQQQSDTRIVAEVGYLRFYTGANERMTIDNSGNVGIGTTSAANVLDVRLASSSGWLARFAETNGAGLILGVDPYSDDALSGFISHTSSNRNIKYQVNGTGKHIFKTAAGDILAINDAGNVGIGTSNPFKAFTVIDGDLFLGKSTVNQVESGRIRFSEFENNSYQGGFIHYNGSANTFNIGVHDANNATSANDANAISMLRSNGNVGIGTTDPGSYRLNVNGQTKINGALDVGYTRPSGASGEGFFFNGTNDYNTSIQLATRTWSASHAILFSAYKSSTQINGSFATTGNTKFTHGPGGYSGGAGMIHFSGNGGALLFYVSQQSTGADTDVNWGTPKMYIKRNGTVAINTINPNDSYKLHVNGTAYADTFVTDAATYADFVFEDDYELKSLSEVEKFIEKNNHLPDIPSEAEAKANGVNLQEMQAKLLQKIEELTLYVIAQQKEIEKLKTQITTTK